MDRQELQMLLADLDAVPEPDPALEQYQTPPDIAAHLLWTAYMQGDLDGMVIDLGCGNGILAIGAAVLGADVRGYDIDPDAVETACSNRDAVGERVNRELSCTFSVAAVSDIEETADTVVMNPPFGLQEEDANLDFVAAAIDTAPVVYALLHRSHEEPEQTRRFIADYAAERGAVTEVLGTFWFPIPATFPFHSEDRAEIGVDLYKFRR